MIALKSLMLDRNTWNYRTENKLSFNRNSYLKPYVYKSLVFDWNTWYYIIQINVQIKNVIKKSLHWNVENSYFLSFA